MAIADAAAEAADAYACLASQGPGGWREMELVPQATRLFRSNWSYAPRPGTSSTCGARAVALPHFDFDRCPLVAVPLDLICDALRPVGAVVFVGDSTMHQLYVNVAMQLSPSLASTATLGTRRPDGRRSQRTVCTTGRHRAGVVLRFLREDLLTVRAQKPPPDLVGYRYEISDTRGGWVEELERFGSAVLVVGGGGLHVWPLPYQLDELEGVGQRLLAAERRMRLLRVVHIAPVAGAPNCTSPAARPLRSLDAAVEPLAAAMYAQPMARNGTWPHYRDAPYRYFWHLINAWRIHFESAFRALGAAQIDAHTIADRRPDLRAGFVWIECSRGTQRREQLQREKARHLNHSAGAGQQHDSEAGRADHDAGRSPRGMDTSSTSMGMWPPPPPPMCKQTDCAHFCTAEPVVSTVAATLLNMVGRWGLLAPAPAAGRLRHDPRDQSLASVDGGGTDGEPAHANSTPKGDSAATSSVASQRTPMMLPVPRRVSSSAHAPPPPPGLLLFGPTATIGRNHTPGALLARPISLLLLGDSRSRWTHHHVLHHVCNASVVCAGRPLRCRSDTATATLMDGAQNWRAGGGNPCASSASSLSHLSYYVHYGVGEPPYLDNPGTWHRRGDFSNRSLSSRAMAVEAVRRHVAAAGGRGPALPGATGARVVVALSSFLWDLWRIGVGHDVGLDAVTVAAPGAVAGHLQERSNYSSSPATSSPATSSRATSRATSRRERVWPGHGGYASIGAFLADYEQNLTRFATAVRAQLREGDTLLLLADYGCAPRDRRGHLYALNALCPSVAPHQAACVRRVGASLGLAVADAYAEFEGHEDSLIEREAEYGIHPTAAGGCAAWRALRRVEPGLLPGCELEGMSPKEDTTHNKGGARGDEEWAHGGGSSGQPPRRGGGGRAPLPLMARWPSVLA